MLRKSAVLLTAWALLLGGEVQADVISGSSSADLVDISLNANVLGVGLLNADIGDLAQDSGAAPAPYSTSQPVANVDVKAGDVLGIVTLARVQAPTATSTVNSIVNGSYGVKSATGTHSVSGLDVSLVHTPGGLLTSPNNLISITADTLSVTSKLTGSAIGNAVAQSLMTVENLQVAVNGTALDLNGIAAGVGLTGSIAPNTGISLGLTGTTLMLNEQVLTGVGTSNVSLVTNGIDLQLLDLQISGLLTGLQGGVLVAPTSASLGLTPIATPEPSTWLLLVLTGIGGIVVARFRRRHEAKAIAAA